MTKRRDKRELAGWVRPALDTALDEVQRRQRALADVLQGSAAPGVWVRNRYCVYQSCLWRTWTMPNNQWEQFVKWVAGFGNE